MKHSKLPGKYVTGTQPYILRLPRHTFFSDRPPHPQANFYGRKSLRPPRPSFFSAPPPPPPLPVHPFQNVGVKVVPPSGRKAIADTEEVFSSAFDTEKLLTENFSKETNLDDARHHHHHLFICFPF